MIRRLSDPLDLTEVDRLTEHPAEEARRCDRRDACEVHRLFRRAIVDGDEAAWAALDGRCRPQLERWARTHRLYAAAGEEAAALANRALERLWRGVGPDRFAAFPNASSLLGYLRRCVHRLVVDAARERARERRRAEALGVALAGRAAPAADPDGAALADLWAAVRAHCRDGREARVALGGLALGLRPAEVAALWPAEFDGAAAVHAARANLLRRLRRSPDVRRAWRELGVDGRPGR